MTRGFPLARPGMRIGLLGGSFDPAHEGHVHITETARRRFCLDRVWWLVSPGNPLKAHGPAPLAERMATARRLLDDPAVIVTDVEMRLGTRLTADTIAALTRHYPGVRFVWLMGSDNLCQFHLWDRWREIAAMVPIGVLARPGTRIPARNAVAAQILRRWRLPQDQAGSLARRRPPAWVLINLPMKSHSSSAIRAARSGVAEGARR
ncbi:nicotinate-nucleotide adenylyltransferase [Paracoccus spongiarum]|uniref:Probable nicotinate-nucleotide adenylyltransferase n=1 Tax=Paracoccus spongiarum TaxID=3064387 RepID=A0ABT9JBJ3_9RHOB|nr:nicotinate-nucleotide adenylyltransferase [Paracoccus sp. 2205BS29-5]MDP5307209.1 nicotinate-nucleotide adenylyltransferase [Paracoccus sp. 2205BS29-5]